MPDETVAGRPRPSIFAALRVRDFALLWSGHRVSSLGDGITQRERLATT